MGIVLYIWGNITTMSKINLHCDEVSWGEVFPGVTLVQVVNNLDPKNPFVAPNGVEMDDGRFGLTRINDPFVAFSVEPLYDPFYGITNPDELRERARQVVNEQGQHEGAGWRFEQVAKQVYAELRGDFATIGWFYGVLCKHGYRPDQHGFAGYYVSHHLAAFILAHETAELPVIRRGTV